MKPQDIWNATYNRLELQLDRANFDTWLRHAEFLNYEAGVFVISAPNSYARDMLAYRLYPEIQRVLCDMGEGDFDLRFEVVKPTPQVPIHRETHDMPLFRLLEQHQNNPEPENNTRDLLQQPARTPLATHELNPRYTFERFIVNRSNQVVHEAARAVADYPATVYNPFLIYGGVGLGKTHMLQAVAHICAARGLHTIYIPSEVFTNDLIHAIRNRTTAMFRDKYRSADVLLVDDIQFISGKESTQEEFFHTFNALVNFNKQIVLASDRHPRELATLEDRLRSRFQGGLAADIAPPEFETRVAIMHMWAKEREMVLRNDVIEMVAQRAPSNVRELEGVFNQLLAQSRYGDKNVSIARAETTLERYQAPRERLTIEDIMHYAAEKQGVTTDAIRGKRRTGRINKARQITMYIARELTETSLSQIGEAFGGRSHTTILHGCNKIQDEMAYDKVLEARVQNMIRYIKKMGQ